jgi:hypothetical protein
LPDNVDLPEGAAPAGGIASALLVSSLLLARSMRREEPAAANARQARELLQELLDTTRSQTAPVAAELVRRVVQDVMDNSRRQADRLPPASDVQRSLRERWSSIDVPSTRELQRLQKRRPDLEPKRTGIGLGGMAIIGAGSFLVWRLLRGRSEAQKPWYAGMGATE